MTEPSLLPPNSLQGRRLGVSVSESADLSRLGLTPLHCDLAVAELARATFVAGGTIVYGGRLVEPGYTQILLDELRSYRDDRDALALCVPETEWRRLSPVELQRRRDQLHTSAQLFCIDREGNEVDIDRLPRSATWPDAAEALTAMRRFMTDACGARVVIGGRLDGYQGSMSGIVEEAALSIAAARPVYVAGGFGGAAAAVAVEMRSATSEDLGLSDLVGLSASLSSLADLGESVAASGLAPDGLDPTERRQLAVTYRPGEIASLVVTGLGRIAGSTDAA